MNVIDNKEKQRFEAEVDGKIAFVEYSVEPDVLSLNHTNVPEELGGRGIASEMVEAVLMQAELRGYKVKPNCSFVAKYIQRHPEWQSIVAS